VNQARLEKELKRAYALIEKIVSRYSDEDKQEMFLVGGPKGPASNAHCLSGGSLQRRKRSVDTARHAKSGADLRGVRVGQNWGRTGRPD